MSNTPFRNDELENHYGLLNCARDSYPHVTQNSFLKGSWLYHAYKFSNGHSNFLLEFFLFLISIQIE